MTTVFGPGTAIAPAVAAPVAAETVGNEPLTRALANYEAPVESFRPVSRKTPFGQPLSGDARRGGRFLAIMSTMVCVGGIAAEIACMLAAVSGAQQVDKLNWPIAENVWTWDKCEYLPNSDAPATSYGAGISMFYHSLNVLVFAGTISYLVRFATRPIADYGIGVSGMFMFWLGLGLASRWVGTIQLIVGAFLIVLGFVDFVFGWDKFYKAAKAAYTGEEVVEPLPKAAPKSQEEKDKEDARDISRQMESYRPVDRYMGTGMGMGM